MPGGGWIRRASPLITTSIVAFDDLPSCEYMSLPLATIIQLIVGKNQQPLKIEVFTQLVRRKIV